jgi:GAF domain-containing protein
LLTSTASFEELMQSVADVARRAVPGATTCGITLAENGHVITVGSADGLARLLDEQQYEIDDGPCIEAIRTGAVVLTEDLRSESRWDSYPARALAHGIEGIYSSPLIVNDSCIGAMNLYSEGSLAFDPNFRAAAAQLTALAAAIITAALRQYDQVSLTEHLRAALSSRSVIDQAIGILMGTQRCTPEAAFDILRTASQHRNVPLRAIAAELVTRTSRSN